MRVPQRFTPLDIINNRYYVVSKRLLNKKPDLTPWIPKRPDLWSTNIFNLKNWLLRFKLAYKVFKGDVDVLDWEND